MNIYLLAFGILLLVGGILRAAIPNKIINFRLKFIKHTPFAPYAEWVKKNLRFARPLGFVLTGLGLLSIYFSLYLS